jgi:hypothetical protein
MFTFLEKKINKFKVFQIIGYPGSGKTFFIDNQICKNNEEFSIYRSLQELAYSACDYQYGAVYRFLVSILFCVTFLMAGFSAQIFTKRFLLQSISTSKLIFHTHGALYGLNVYLDEGLIHRIFIIFFGVKHNKFFLFFLKQSIKLVWQKNWHIVLLDVDKQVCVKNFRTRKAINSRFNCCTSDGTLSLFLKDELYSYLVNIAKDLSLDVKIIIK